MNLTKFHRVFLFEYAYIKKNRLEKVDYHILISGIVKLLSRKTIMILENQRFNNKYFGWNNCMKYFDKN